MKRGIFTRIFNARRETRVVVVVVNERNDIPRVDSSYFLFPFFLSPTESNSTSLSIFKRSQHLGISI